MSAEIQNLPIPCDIGEIIFLNQFLNWITMRSIQLQGFIFLNFKICSFGFGTKPSGAHDLHLVVAQGFLLSRAEDHIWYWRSNLCQLWEKSVSYMLYYIASQSYYVYKLFHPILSLLPGWVKKWEWMKTRDYNNMIWIW